MIHKYEEDYFNWLCGQIGFGDNTPSPYCKLLKWLFHKPYYWVLIKDANRSDAAYQLRNEYFVEEKRCERPLIGDEVGCNMLEFLVGMARLCHFNDVNGREPAQFFLEFLKNSGLAKANDDTFERYLDDLSQIVAEICCHKTRSNEKYGIFGRKCTDEKKEFWYEMMDFLQK